MSFLKTIKGAFGYGIEVPDYELIKKLNDQIEIRKYLPSKWVGVSVNGSLNDYMSKYQGFMFGKLFNYISGKNNENKKISMTAPVLVDHDNFNSNNIDVNSKCEMSMKFYVPKENQNDTPNPTGENNMFVKSEPEMIVAVSKFGGYATMTDYLKHRDMIVNALGDEAKDYDQVNFMTAGYDPPFKPFNRTNEVWLRKITN